MQLVPLGAAFTLGVIAHNVEEALYLPKWSAHAGRWHAPVGAREFTFAVGVLSLLLVVLAVAAFWQGAGSIWAALFTGYVFTMVANVFVPHVVGSIAMRRHIPGTAIAVALNLPLGLLFLWQAVDQGFVALRTLIWLAPLMALALLASIQVLFALGRRLNSATSQDAI